MKLDFVFMYDIVFVVSKASRDFLMSAESMPLIDVQLLNPRLYEHIPELERCKVCQNNHCLVLSKNCCQRITMAMCNYLKT